jgi:hypothetical protein
MSGFSAEWLKLREPYDLRARNRTVLDAVSDLIADQPSVVIVDLACGTGSTVRALSPRIKARQHWRLVDSDLSVLARVPSSSPPGINVTAVPMVRSGPRLGPRLCVGGARQASAARLPDARPTPAQLIAT